MTFSLPANTPEQVMPETTVNPVIESSIWAYQVSLLLSPKSQEKLTHIFFSAKATDVVKLDDGSLKEAAKQVRKSTVAPSFRCHIT